MSAADLRQLVGRAVPGEGGRPRTGTVPGSPFRAAAARLLFLLAVLMATVVASALPAQAHAQLQEASPADGDELADAPDRVRLRFDEPVTISPGGIRVFNSRAERVDDGSAGHGEGPETVRVDLATPLAPGTYVVTWRVASEDGHPVRGAHLFTVGDIAAADDSLLAALFSRSQDRPFAVAAAVLRWLIYAGTLLAAGGAVFLGRLRRDTDAGRQRLVRIVVWAAVVGITASVLSVFVQAALVTGLGVAAFADARSLRDALVGPVGVSTAVGSLALAAVAAGLLRPRISRWLPEAAAAAALGALLLEGHTMTTDPRWLVLLADAVHAAAAAIWFGGLVLLAADLRQRRGMADPLDAGRLVAAFSRVATTAIVAVIVAGLTLGWLEVRALRALTSTTYGWTLLTKMALFVPVLAAGLYNNRRLVPVLARAAAPRMVADRPVPAGGAATQPRHAAAWRLLRRTLAVEITAIVAVLAATAVLVSLQPAAEAAGITGAYSSYVPLGDDWELNLTVDPNRAGQNEIHMYVLAETGRQVDVDGDVEMTLSLPTRDIGPIRRTPTRLGPGHFFLSGPELSVPGGWEITVTVPVSRFEQATATVPVVVNP